MGEVFYTKQTGWTEAGIAEQDRRREMETDLMKLTAVEFYDLVFQVGNGLTVEEWPEIRRRLEKLEKCEAELLEARAFQELRLLEAERLSERLEQYEALVQRYLLYHDGVARCESAEKRQACLCSICDAARAALEGK